MNLLERVAAEDGSAKSLWGLPDRRRSVESIAFSIEGRPYVCISTQIGCPVGCVFCETGRQQTLGNLSADEIYAQVEREAVDASGAPRKLHRVVIAGMGEPLLNLDAVAAASRRMLDDALTAEVSITTSGIVPAMAQLDAVPITVLSVSLHATTDAVRNRLIPTNRKYGLDRVIEASVGYRHRTGTQVIMNYLLFDGVNDSDDDAERLVALLDPALFSVKLKCWNDIDDTALVASPGERFAYFRDRLVAAGFDTTIDRSAGTEVGGGCGQLRSSERTIRRPALA